MDEQKRLDAVLRLAEQYRYDAVHAHQVECLAGTIFMELTSEHGLERGDRKLLEYAAILHDIGYFVAARSHHRHALMMILAEPLPVFSRDEVKLIANVARYHRKALPTPEHTLFGALSAEDRTRVEKLAAMLRVADALDRSKRGLVRELTCDVMDDTVIFRVVADGDMAVETAALARRGDLFRAVFRRTPRVDVQAPRLITAEAVYQGA